MQCRCCGRRRKSIARASEPSTSRSANSRSQHSGDCLHATGMIVSVCMCTSVHVMECTAFFSRTHTRSTHTHTHARTRTQERTQERTHTRTHTHTHTQRRVTRSPSPTHNAKYHRRHTHAHRSLSLAGSNLKMAVSSSYGSVPASACAAFGEVMVGGRMKKCVCVRARVSICLCMPACL